MKFDFDFLKRKKKENVAVILKVNTFVFYLSIRALPAALLCRVYMKFGLQVADEEMAGTWST